MNKQQYERAKELGRQAARAGKKQGESPYRSSPSLRDLHMAWVEGWNEGKR